MRNAPLRKSLLHAPYVSMKLEHRLICLEPVLIEAMGAGVPPVVLGPGAESYVVQHEVTGLVALTKNCTWNM